MKNKIGIALLLVLVLLFAAVPAFAQGNPQSDRVCFGGPNITLSANDSARDVVGFGCSVTVEQGAHVYRDLFVFGGNATIAGQVDRDASVFGGNLSLKSTAVVGRDVFNFGGVFDRADGAHIGRNVTTQSGEGGFVTPIAPVGPFVVTPFNAPGDFFLATGIGFVRDILIALAFAALGVLLVVFFPTPMQRVMSTAQGSFAPSLGVGCLTLLVTPILLILLLLTLIGPVAYVIALIAVWVFGWTAIGYLAGERILQGLKVQNITPILSVVVGVIILSLVSAVPCVGAIVWLLVGSAGVGAVILTRFGTRVYPFTPALVPANPLPPAPPQPPPTPAESNPPSATPTDSTATA